MLELTRHAASVYTELNAVSKGVSLGLYDKGKGKGSQATVGGAQPYIDLMGRRYVSCAYHRKQGADGARRVYVLLALCSHLT
jgi:hypothetical protein